VLRNSTWNPLLLTLSASGGATGWTLVAGRIEDRWLAEWLLSVRAGCPQLTGPTHPRTYVPEVTPPTDWVGPAQSCGRASGKPLLHHELRPAWILQREGDHGFAVGSHFARDHEFAAQLRTPSRPIVG
jgi:hypothetical protein